MTVLDLLIPLIMVAVALVGLSRKQDVYGLLVEGGRDGLRVLASIVPALVMLLSATSMLRASGAMDALAAFLSPALRYVGIPPEVAPLLVVRPISGSAALALGADLIAAYGPDSTVGRTAAILLGSTETTFYAVSVYCGAAGISKTRYAIPAALLADCTGFLVASCTARWLF